MTRSQGGKHTRRFVFLAVEPLLSGIPKAVEVTRRSRDGAEYYFILNHADQSVPVSPGDGFTDLLEGTPAPARFTLAPFAYKVLKRAGPVHPRNAGRPRREDRATSP